MNDPEHLVKSVVAELSEDGKTAELRFCQAHGETRLRFPTSQTVHLVVDIEEALGVVHAGQQEILRGQDPRPSFPMRARDVASIMGGHFIEGCAGDVGGARIRASARSKPPG